MLSLKDIKAIRRHNLCLLLDSYGQAALHEATGIAEAYLYQMGKGKGTKSRGINDNNARLIEAGAGLTSGWMDVDRRQQDANVIELDVRTAKARRAMAWPFRTVERERFEKLDESDRLRVESAMIKALAAIEAPKKAGSPGRR